MADLDWLTFTRSMPTSAIMPHKSACQPEHPFERRFFVRGSPVGREPELPWIVTDDLPENIAVTSEEIDLFQAYFGDVLDDLLARDL